MSKQTNFSKYKVLGVEIDALTKDEAVDYIVRRAGNDGPAFSVAKPYVEFIDRAATDKHIARLLNQAELCLPDGVALNWATLFLYGGKPSFWRIITTGPGMIINPTKVYKFLPDRFSGANFTWQLLEAAGQQNLKIFLVGSPRTSTIQHTVAAITKRIPQTNIVGVYPGTWQGLSGESLYQQLKAGLDISDLVTTLEHSRPDIVLVGMGFPQQDELCAQLAAKLKHGAFIGEGGTFDYASFGGKYKRAPKFLQKVGLEWLWRLILEPRRIGRQLAIPRFTYRVWRKH